MAAYKDEGRIAILTLTVIAAATIAARRAVARDGTYAAAGAHMHGISFVGGVAGDEMAVDVLGVVPVEAGGVIAADALLEVGTDGKLITKSSGKAVARAQTAASADGAIIYALLLPANT